jgi:protein-tyrosine phosphatase
MDPTAARVLRGLGGRPEGFEARQLTARTLQEADLVLTMTRHQREAALSLAPRALRRTFTLREAADLVGRVDLDVLPPPAVLAERGRALAASLDAARPARPGVDRGGDDIADPVGRRTAVHARVGREVHQALLPLVQALCSSGVAEHRPSFVELTERVSS